VKSFFVVSVEITTIIEVQLTRWAWHHELAGALVSPHRDAVPVPRPWRASPRERYRGV